MPSPPTTDLPRPKSWDEFEDICADVLKRLWKDPYIVRNGRSGQKQHGVDIYGHPEHLGGSNSGDYSGAQCKDIELLDLATVEAEVKKAIDFQPNSLGIPGNDNSSKGCPGSKGGTNQMLALPRLYYVLGRYQLGTLWAQ